MVRDSADARLGGCAVVRERLLDYCVWIIIIAIMMLVSMPHLRRCSPHVNRLGIVW